MPTEKTRLYARCALCVALLALGAIPQPVIASTGSAINVTVILTAVPCEINGNLPIEVNFGDDVQTTLVGGSYKKKPVTYSVGCPPNAPSAMKVRIDGVGAGAGFGSNVLRTEIPNFGIAISSNGTPQPINSWKDFTYPNWPRFEAVPVKRAGVTLRGGVFSAGAVMTVEYR